MLSDLDRYRLVAPLDGARRVADATLTADGAMVVVGGGDGLLRFWDLSGHPLWKLQAHKFHVLGIHLEGDDTVICEFADDVFQLTNLDPDW